MLNLSSIKKVDRRIPPEIIGEIILASFNQEYLPYKEKEWNESIRKIYFNLSIVNKLFLTFTRTCIFTICINNSNQTLMNDSLIRIGKIDSIIQRIRKLYIGDKIDNLLQLLNGCINLNELWINCSGIDNDGDVTLLSEFPESIRTLHLYSEKRSRWIDVPSIETSESSESFVVNVSRLSISTTFITPLSYGIFRNLTTLSILVEFSCNISPDDLIKIFKRIGPQLIKLQILQYGPQVLPNLPSKCFQYVTNLKHFSISGSIIIPLYLNEISSELISLRYINSYSDYLPQTFIVVPFCLSKLKRLGFPKQLEMKGKEGLDIWAKNRNIELVELGTTSGKWQEDLDLLEW